MGAVRRRWHQEDRLIDTDGTEWLTVTEAARRYRVRPSAIRNWATRGKVQSHRIGRHAYVRTIDVAQAEHAWRTRVARKENS